MRNEIQKYFVKNKDINTNVENNKFESFRESSNIIEKKGMFELNIETEDIKLFIPMLINLD